MPFRVVKILSVSSGSEDFQIENAKHRGQTRASAIILVLDLVQPLDDPTIFAHILYAYFICLRSFCFSLLAILWPQSQTETALRVILVSFKMYSQIKIQNNSDEIHILINIRRGFKRLTSRMGNY